MQLRACITASSPSSPMDTHAHTHRHAVHTHTRTERAESLGPEHAHFPEGLSATKLHTLALPTPRNSLNSFPKPFIIPAYHDRHPASHLPHLPHLQFPKHTQDADILIPFISSSFPRSPYLLRTRASSFPYPIPHSPYSPRTRTAHSPYPIPHTSPGR